MSVEQFTAIVNRYIEAFEKQDLAIIKDLYAPDASVEDPVGSTTIIGLDDILAFYEKAFASGAKLSLNAPIRVAGNSVAFSFEVKMPNLSLSPIDVFEINNEGKIQSMKAYWSNENITML